MARPDNLLCTVLPLIVRYDTEFRCDSVTVHPPEILPSEYVEEAKQLMGLPDEQAYHVGSGCFYVKNQWQTPEKERKKVTAKWVADYERGLRGDIKQTTRLSSIDNHYLGLCKVTVPDGVSKDSDYACDCDLYNLYLCCAHSIFVRHKLGVVDIDALTTKLGRIRTAGAPRLNRGALSKTDEGPLRKRKR